VPHERKFYGWKLVAALSAMDFLNLGFPAYIGTIINPYMLEEILMSRSTVGLGFTFLNLFVGLPATLVAISIMKRGIRATYLIGSALIFVGSCFLAFFTRHPWQYVLGFGVINGAGICFGDIIPGTTAAARWFERYRGRAVGLVLSGSGISGFFVAPLVDRFLRAHSGNWRLGWGMVAGAGLLAGLIALLFIKERPEDLGQLPDGGRKPQRDAAKRDTSHLVTKFDWTPGEAYRTTAYWLIVVGGLAAQFPFFLFTAHWVLHLRGAGVRSGAAAFAMGLFTISCIAGRLVGGWLMDTMTARYTFMLGLCCYLVGSLAALHVGPNALLIAYSGAVFYGLGIGWTFTAMTTSVAHFYGPTAFPKLAGMMLLLTSGGASPAGWIGGKIFDLSGGYARAWDLNIAITVIGILAMAFAVMPRPKDRPFSVAEANA